MSVKITVNVNREAAIAAGHDQWGHQVINVDLADLTQDEREEVSALAEKRVAGSDELTLDGTWILVDGTTYSYPTITSPDLNALRQVLAARRQARDQEQAKREKAAAAHEQRVFEILADPEALLVQPYGRDDRWFLRGPSDDRLLAVEAKMQIVAEERNATRQAKLDDERRRAAMEAKQAEAKRREPFAAWVAEHGTADQRERWEAGALPLEEVMTGMREQEYGQVPLAEYEPLTAQDVSHGGECYDYAGNVEFEVDDLGTYTAEQWQERKVILAALPHPDDTTLTLRRHEAVCQDCEEKAARYGIRAVYKPAPGITLRREFGLESH